MIEDDDASSRVPTPRPPEAASGEKVKEDKPAGEAQSTGKVEEKSSEQEKDGESSEKPPGDTQSSQDVQLKLRRLQKLESKYNGMSDLSSPV